MGRDLKLYDEDRVVYSYGNIKTQGWLDGQAGGVEKAAVVIEGMAEAAFRAERDDEAVKLRALAKQLRKDLVPQLQREAKEHAKNHPETDP